MNYKEKDIDQIIEGCISGNRKSQEFLFKMFHGKMKTVAMTYMKDEDSSQDILSDAFIKVFSKIKQYDKSGNIGAWIRKIVVNTAIDSIRKNKKLFFIDDSKSIESESLISEQEEFEFEGFEYSDIAPEEFIKMIQELPDGYRVVFNMKLFENMGHKEIADKLGIVEGTSKSNYSRARSILKDKANSLIKEKRDKEEGMKKTCREMDVEKSK